MYVGFVKDGFDNRIISSIVTDRKTPKATNKLFRYAFNNNSYLPNKTIIHTDQGVEFNNSLTNKYVYNKKLVNSFSPVASPTSNATMETLMSAFKRDFNPDNEKLTNKKSLQKLVDSYVDIYNNVLPQERLN
jgi:transposase InsO family protein